MDIKNQKGEEKLFSWHNLLIAATGIGLWVGIEYVINHFSLVREVGSFIAKTVATIIFILIGIALLWVFLKDKLKGFIHKCIKEYNEKNS